MTEQQELEKFVKISIKSLVVDTTLLENLLSNLSDKEIANWGRNFDATESYTEAERTNISHWKTKEKESNYIYVNSKNAYTPKSKDEFGKYIFNRQDYQEWLFNRVLNVLTATINEKKNETPFDKIGKAGCAFIFLGLALFGIALIFKIDWIGLVGVILFALSFLYFTVLRYYNSRKHK
jgi:hypothetical protein